MMEEDLYVVNKTNSPGGLFMFVVIATVSKLSDTSYRYTPRNLDIDSKPRLKVEHYFDMLPPILSRRVISKDRPDVDKILESYGLDEYDAWEILKITQGLQPGDTIHIWTDRDLKTAKQVLGPMLVINGMEETDSASAAAYHYYRQALGEADSTSVHDHDEFSSRYGMKLF